MSAVVVPWAIAFSVFAVFVLVVLNVTLAARGARREEPPQPPVAETNKPEQGAGSLTGEPGEVDAEDGPAVPSLAALDCLRRLPGVRGVALWGAHGAVLQAEGDLLGTILPEASRLLETLHQAGAAIGTGPWMSFRVEGLGGTIYGAKMRGVSLVAVVDPSADSAQIERQLYQATLRAPIELLVSGGDADQRPLAVEDPGPDRRAEEPSRTS